MLFRKRHTTQVAQPVNPIIEPIIPTPQPAEPIDLVHEQVVGLYDRAGSLIERMHACRAALATEDAEALNPPITRVLGDMLSSIREWLSAGSASYREGKSVDYLMDSADEALQVVEGLLGRSDKSDFEALGSRIRSVALRMKEQEDDDEHLLLAGEMVNQAIVAIGHAFRFRKYGRELFNSRLQNANIVLDRAVEALHPDSAGVQLVSRLDALKTPVRLVSAA